MSKIFSGAVFGTYALAGRLATPLLALYLRRRLKRGKEDPNRLSERWGREKTPRPAGALVWIHAASLGESLAVLPMIGRIRDERPDLTLLMTSGTVTAAKLLGERLPPGVLHRYVPIDAPQAVGRFLNHWKPDLGLLVESELWPNLLRLAHRRGLPLALINARMSSRSHQRWRRVRPLAFDLLGRLTLVLAESEESAARFRDLGAREVASLGNLKTAAAPLAADEIQLENLSSALGTRARWLAASTHEGEEALALEAHKMLAPHFPDLITLIVPRHPERGIEVALLAGRQGLAAQQRSLGLLPGGDDRIYIGDTLGEMGLFYRVSPIAFVGGSLVPKGGQNPLEPARLGAALLYGPHSDNFKAQTEKLEAAGALTRVTSAKELAMAVDVLLRDPALRRQRGAAAEAASATEEKILADSLAALRPLLPR